MPHHCHHHHHCRVHPHHIRNVDEEEHGSEEKMKHQQEFHHRKPSTLSFILLSSIISFSLLVLLLTCCFSISHVPFQSPQVSTISCDRKAFHTDVCLLRGGYVQTHSPSNSILLHPATGPTTPPPPEQLIRPYPRKWETAIMTTIRELRLRYSDDPVACEVRHDAPAVVFSAGGYTGNLFHEFNDGILPLYITARHLRRRVVLLVLDYRNWWFTKYRDVLSRLSDFPPVDFSNDTRVHCFPQAIVGLRVHGDLAVDAAQIGGVSSGTTTIEDFRQMLDEAYRPRIRSLELEEERERAASLSPQPPPEPSPAAAEDRRPRLAMVSRNGSRAIENEGEVVAAAEEVGFKVEVLRPDRTTELARIYRTLNGSDAMVGVHGAAMTHFLFMRPGSAFIQVVPLGTRWAAETYYGEPAVKMGLWYSAYRVRPEESSLYREYGRDDPVLLDPEAVTADGWEVTKRVYLDRQNVRLNLRRFRRRLISAYQYLILKRQRQQHASC